MSDKINTILKFWYCFVLSSILILGCAKDTVDVKDDVKQDDKYDIEDVVVDSYGKSTSVNNLVSGKARIKISEELAVQIEQTKSSCYDLFVKVKSNSQILEDMGIVSIERTFPYAGEFEERTREMGLHLWYDIEFNEGFSLTKAGNSLLEIDGVESMEYVPQVMQDGKIVYNPFGGESLGNIVRDSNFNIFDDPYLYKQWHYNNNDSVGSSRIGCDINIFPVWERYTTGSDDVVVSVVDGGVDFTHEDLKDNMWINPDQEGDNVYGYNFVKSSYTLESDNHGTHVAGTVAAVNNNGKGVAGVAGGDYKKGIKGARIMSCQIFGKNDKQGNIPNAIKWGADHGAVISQNSWGYKDISYIPNADRLAIEYFIDNAGYDKNKVQTGPMAGGIVIFSAGNYKKDIASPASFDKVIAVAALGAAYEKASYSNYGSWVDICAPGGETSKGKDVHSTLPGNRYGDMQGTSMACPHVSGIAALIISKYGRKGFTNSMLKEMLFMNNRDVSAYNPTFYVGKLIDAAAIFGGMSTLAPDKISDLAVSAKSNRLLVSFTVPSDRDDSVPSSVILYYRTDKSAAIGSCDSISLKLNGYRAGDKYKEYLNGFKFSTRYYIKAVAVDFANNRSDVSDELSVLTGGNSVPVIQPVDGVSKSVNFAKRSDSLGFSVLEPDGHNYSVSLKNSIKGIMLSAVKNNLFYLQIDTHEATGGNFDVDSLFNPVIVVKDEYGASVELKVTFKVLKNNPPVLVKPIDNIITFGLGEKSVIDLSDYFSDPDNEVLKFSYDLSVADILKVSVSKDNLIFYTSNYGNTDISISAIDGCGKRCSVSFSVAVRDKDREIELFPTTTKDYIYIRTVSNQSGSVCFYNGIGAKVLDQAFESTPFESSKIDVKNLSGGVYTVKVKAGGIEKKFSVVKL